MIDNDPDRYPVQQLLLWKHQAEYEQYCNVNGITVSDNSMLHQELKRRKLEACRNLKSALERLHQRLCYAYEYWRGKVEKNVNGIEGLCVIEPAVHGDSRVYFMETYSQRDMEEAGIDITFVQDNQALCINLWKLKKKPSLPTPHKSAIV